MTELDARSVGQRADIENGQLVLEFGPSSMRDWGMGQYDPAGCEFCADPFRVAVSDSRG